MEGRMGGKHFKYINNNNGSLFFTVPSFITIGIATQIVLHN